jgi:hypothetical protein
MKNETTYTTFDLEQIALRAAFALNADLINNEAFCGYCGSKAEFDNLYLECLRLAQAARYPSLDLILDAYWSVQEEICAGDRAVDWYL